MKNTVAWLGVLWLAALSTSPLAAEEAPPIAPQRIEYFRQWLPEKPRGVGPTIADRAAWEQFAKYPAFAAEVKKAEALRDQPMPELPDDLYLDFSRTGNRTRYQSVASKRYQRLSTLVYAECLEDRGRFLPAMERAIQEICDQKTWVLPAHDWKLRNFKGEICQIDLRSADVSWNLATIAYWLGEKLRPEVRQRIADELERRTFTPWESYVHTGAPRMSWPLKRHNWNAVCLANVTGAALANLQSRERRAFFAAAAEKYIKNYLRGFSPDGYCSEGIAYWNYGFGHYLMLAETLRQATDGKVDWLRNDRLRPIAMSVARTEILPGIYPAFADCPVGRKPDALSVAVLSRRMDLGLSAWEAHGQKAAQAPQVRLAIFGLLTSSEVFSTAPSPERTLYRPPLRDWFQQAGILICRPAPKAKNALGAALKGGHNGEFHNHNDVGSFVVALGRSTPIVDPGKEVYTRRTFGRRRYESNVINSFGHSVPRVAGRLQRYGSNTRAKVLKTEFTDSQDTYVLDLRAAYDVAALKKLQRTFVFSREGSGKLTVTDEVEFDSPKTFDTALITFGPWKQIDETHLRVGKAPDAVAVEIRAEGGAFRLDPQEIHEDLGKEQRTPIRLGIEFTRPVTKAKIVTVITPAE